MTEKRFYIECEDYNAWSIWEDNKCIVFDLKRVDAQLICDKLNELHDENKLLKKQLETVELAMYGDEVDVK